MHSLDSPRICAYEYVMIITEKPLNTALQLRLHNPTMQVKKLCQTKKKQRHEESKGAEAMQLTLPSASSVKH